MKNYKVLIIEDSFQIRSKVKNGLKEKGLNAKTTNNMRDALEILKNDGDIQAVLTNWRVRETKDSKEFGIEGKKVFDVILKYRYDLVIFLFTRYKDPRKIESDDKIRGYFYKNDFDYDDIYRKVDAVVMEKSKAPFFNKLVEYSKKSNDSWHTPGHSSGDSIKNSKWVKDYYNFFGHNMFASDISVSVPTLDSLFDPKPEGVITKAQELAANAFRAKKTFFVTNGTSTSNKILIQTLLKPSEAILLDRNCHKSVHYGVIAAGAEPIYMLPSANNKHGIFGPVPKKRIIDRMDKAIEKGKKVKAMIITNCTYDGLIYDIEEIVNEAHKRNIKVIVDEAWFGYANFHPDFYPSAMAAGADYATQSTHKVMSAFSQASMIHVNDPEFEEIEDLFHENYMMYTSTSPGYPMIASLDMARKQMVMEGYKLLSKVIDISNDLRDSINSLEEFKVLKKEDLISEELKDDNIKLDKTKITIDISKSGFSNKELEYYLENDFGIQLEKSTFNTITVLITIGTTRSKANRLFLALESLSKRAQGKKSNNGNKFNYNLKLSKIKYIPRHAFYADGKDIKLENSEGEIATKMIVPYPPGIPILVPGQIVTKEIIDYLLKLYKKNVEIHGMKKDKIKVATKEDLKKLESRGFNIS